MNEKTGICPSCGECFDLDSFKRCESSLLGELEKLKEENEKLKLVQNLYDDLCREWNESCEPDCDSFAHSENCQYTSLAALKRKLKEENKEENL